MRDETTVAIEPCLDIQKDGFALLCNSLCEHCLASARRSIKQQAFRKREQSRATLLLLKEVWPLKWKNDELMDLSCRY